jgi:hypothetical protein
VTWCRSIGCQAIFQVPGEVDDPSLAAKIVQYTEDTLGFHPVDWEIGNEPGFWSHWGQSWGNWSSSRAPPGPMDYAEEVGAYAGAMRAVDANIHLIGLPGVGRSGSGTIATWVSDVVQVAGRELSAVAVHIYPDTSGGNSSLSQFYSTLSASNSGSIASRYPALETDLAKALADCSGCGPIQVMFTEVGSAITGHPDASHYSLGFPESIYVAAEATQAMTFNVTNIDAYATVLGTANSWIDASGGARPLYELESQVLSRLGPVAYPVSFSGGPTGLYGIATTSSTYGGTAALLVVNTNLENGAAFAPVLPGGLDSAATTIVAWNNNSTVEPVARLSSGLPASYVLPPNSLVLFQSHAVPVAPVRFLESGLPAGTRWFVGLGNSFSTSVSPNITFDVPAGTYNVDAGPMLPCYGNAEHERWSPSAPESVNVGSTGVNVTVPYRVQSLVDVGVEPAGAGWTSPSSGWFDVGSPFQIAAHANSGWVFRNWIGGGTGNYSGKGTLASVAPSRGVSETAWFVPGYLVNLSENGLPAGTSWSVEVGGANYSSSGASIYLLEPNGTHGFRVNPVPGFYPRPASGYFTVYGAEVGPIVVNFTRSATAFLVNFTESGLPAGTNWSVVVRGTLDSSTGPTISLYAINGTYAYNVSTLPGFSARPPRGGFSVNGTGVSVAVTFVANISLGFGYPVEFAEDGLPVGTSWSVLIRNDTLQSAGPDLVVDLPNGTFTYYVGPVPDHVAHPPEGGLTVAGASPSVVSIGFTVGNGTRGPDFPVVWQETGLANGTGWSVSVRHVLYSSTAFSITAAEPSGNFSFNVTAISGFAANPARGGFSVPGQGPAPIAVSFVPVFPVTFVEGSLPSGVPWSVRVGGQFATGASPTLTVDLPSGTWSFVVAGPAGYAATPSSGSLSVSNSSVSESVRFVLSGASVTVGGPFVDYRLVVTQAIAVSVVLGSSGLVTFRLLARRSRPAETALAASYPPGAGMTRPPLGVETPYEGFPNEVREPEARKPA